MEYQGRRASMILTVYVRKSQIAIEYAHRFREQHLQGHVLWAYAANETRFMQAYQDIASQLRLPGYQDPQVNVCKLVCEWLNDLEDIPWLMVLDNSDHEAHFLPAKDETEAERSVRSSYLAGYLPTKFNHSQFLLITTRSRDIGEHLSHGQPCVDVGPFSGQEAIDLLLSKVRVFDPYNTLEIDSLVEILGRIPLAITQAAAFINRNKISVRQYAEEIAINKQILIDYLSIDLQDPRRERGFPNSVFRTWKLSFDQIQSHSPRAAEILSLMAMLDGQKISEDLIRKDGERLVDFRTAIGTLDGYSIIIKEAGGKTCAIHPLVQLSVQYMLEKSGQTTFYMGQALQLIAKKFPNGEHENRAICESLFPHAQAVLQHDMKSEATISSCSLLLHNVGWFEMRRGRYEAAYRNVQSAYQIRQELFGDEVEETLNSLDLLGLVLQYHGKYEEAEKMNRRALAGFEKVLGVGHPDTLTSINRLASVLQSQGKYVGAEEMNRRALAGFEKVLGVDHPYTLTSVHNLAVLLHSQQHFEQASILYQRALSGRRQTLGPAHPSTLRCDRHYSDMLEEMEAKDRR